MATSFCVNCGGSVDGSFCSACGTAVARAATNSVSQQTYSAPTFSAQSASTGSGQVGFGEAITLYFKNYANFEGRSSQSAYWFVYLFNFIVSMAALLIDNTIVHSVIGPNAVLQTIVALAFLVPGLAIGVRRLHDTGRSGHSLWFALIPFVGAILLIVWLASKSEPADNRFGPRA